MRPMRHPRSRVSQVRIRFRRGSCSSIHISIVRNVPETSIKAVSRGLGLSLLLALETAHADEPPCPPSYSEAQVQRPEPASESKADPSKLPTEITGEKVE